VNVIGIHVKKALLDSAIKSSFLECVIESNIEREETLLSNTILIGFSRNNMTVNNMYAYIPNICEIYTMKSTLPSEEDSALVVSVDE